MQLVEAIPAIGYDSTWGIWAELIEGELKEESPARYGQKCFENGGMLDSYVFVCNGETAGDHLAEWRDDDGKLVDGWFDELIYPLNQAKPWADAN